MTGRATGTYRIERDIVQGAVRWHVVSPDGWRHSKDPYGDEDQALRAASRLNRLRIEAQKVRAS